jgi:hypothetical protein
MAVLLLQDERVVRPDWSGQGSRTLWHEEHGGLEPDGGLSRPTSNRAY